MKVPSEAELIALENWVIGLYYRLGDTRQRPVIYSSIPTDDAIERIKTLITIARAQLPPVRPYTERLLPRIVKPEPASKAPPKQKGKFR